MIWPTLSSQQPRLLHCVCSPPHFYVHLPLPLFWFFPYVYVFFYAPIPPINMQTNCYCPYMPLGVYHQRKTVAISENDANRYHQSNSINLINGQHKSKFDPFWWMIRHTFAQYANVKQCGTLIQFTVYVAKEKCTENALYYLLMNLHSLEILHIGTVGYAMKIYFHSITLKMIKNFGKHYMTLIHLSVWIHYILIQTSSIPLKWMMTVITLWSTKVNWTQIKTTSINSLTI